MKNSQHTFYDAIVYIGIFAVPIAPAVFFGWSIGTAVLEMTSIGWISVLVGIISALGLEIVGITSGHVAVNAFDREEYGVATVASLILLAYLALGISGLIDLVDRGVVMFLVSPLVYTLAAIQSRQRKKERAEEAKESRERRTKERDSSIERESKAEAKERRARERHELKLERLRLEHERKKEETAVRGVSAPLSTETEIAFAPVMSKNGRSEVSSDDTREAILRVLRDELALPEDERRSNAEIGRMFTNPRTGRPFTGQRVGQLKSALLKERD